MVHDAWGTANWSDKLRILWSRTGWRPDDMAERYPTAKSDLEDFKKYDPKLGAIASIAIIGQYVLISFFHFWGAQKVSVLSVEVLWATVIAQAYTLLVIGAALDGKRYMQQLEYTRLLVLGAMLFGSFNAGLIGINWLYYGSALLLVSAGVMRLCVNTGLDDVAETSSDPA
jgi:hypothetical protein